MTYLFGTIQLRYVRSGHSEKLVEISEMKNRLIDLDNKNRTT
jgi:hypothetical protein